MKKLLAMLLALLLLTAIGCGSHPDFKETAFVDYDGPFTETESLAETEAESLAETEAKVPTETEAETEAPVPEDPDELRVIYLDNNRDRVNDHKIVVNITAARSTEKAPYTPTDDSFRTVSLYALSPEGKETLLWYTNLCMGSSPRGGVGLYAGSELFVWYYDLYDSAHESGTQQLSIRLMRLTEDYRLAPVPGGNLFKVPSEDTANWVESKLYEIQLASHIINDKLDDAEILLDVTGNTPVYSTDDNRITKEYIAPSSYNKFYAAFDEATQDAFIIPAK